MGNKKHVSLRPIPQASNFVACKDKLLTQTSAIHRRTSFANNPGSVIFSNEQADCHLQMAEQKWVSRFLLHCISQAPHLKRCEDVDEQVIDRSIHEQHFLPLSDHAADHAAEEG